MLPWSDGKKFFGNVQALCGGVAVGNAASLIVRHLPPEHTLVCINYVAGTNATLPNSVRSNSRLVLKVHSRASLLEDVALECLDLQLDPRVSSSTFLDAIGDVWQVASLLDEELTLKTLKVPYRRNISQEIAKANALQ